MTSQAAIFAETIASMKRAVKRKSYDSESDSSIEHLTNRGNKLKRKARFVHEDQLAPPTGPQVYREVIEHAGYYRDIISRNPPLVDEDGYEVDSDDDDERAHTAMAAAAEFDPYSEVKIERLLMPLTAASDLSDHPTLSKPFLSKTLTDLTQHAREMVQKEKDSLWKMKHLLTRLSGDNTWIPCESVEKHDDIELFLDDREKIRASILGKPVAKEDADHASTGTLVSDDVAQPPALLDTVAKAAEVALEGVKRVNGEKENDTIVRPMRTDEETTVVDTITANESGDEYPKKNGTGSISDQALEAEFMETDGAIKLYVAENGENQALEGTEMDIELGVESQDNIPAPHRMRTRAQAQAASDNTAPSRTRSMSPGFNNETFIHPYFLAPRSSHPDRDIGLPQGEADDVRRLLQLYIQKQEEVCRGAQRIYDGLLKVDRYRKLVMKWAKAEAHVGVNRDMSDGEDWYDKEEWGLDEDLKKGQDEEEEDAATTAKKTRTRRQ